MRGEGGRGGRWEGGILWEGEEWYEGGSEGVVNARVAGFLMK